MASIKFNNEIIDIDIDNLNNIDIYDLNIFTNENFNFIKDNPYYYESINISNFDYTLYTSKTDNYKKLYKNFIYANKINNYNKFLLSKIYNTTNLVLNKNEDNLISSISLYYKNNQIINFHRYLFDIENKNIEFRLINQYLYYMNIYFTNKYKSIERKLKEKKETNNNKTFENILRSYKNQENEIKYLKYKVNTNEERIIFLENKINNMNMQILYLFILSLLIVLKLFKDNFM